MTPNEKLKKIREEIVEMSTKGATITILCKDGKYRDYNLRKYAETCVYTEAIRAQAKATVNIALEYDSDLIQVSDHNTITEICEEYEGKVFSISGNDPDFPYLDQEPPFHVNCKHTITIIFREIIEKYGVDKYKRKAEKPKKEKPKKEKQKKKPKKEKPKKVKPKKEKPKKEPDSYKDNIDPFEAVSNTKNFNQLEKDSLIKYKTDHFVDINYYLRNGEILKKGTFNKYTVPRMNDVLKQINSSFTKSVLKENIIVYKGMEIKNINKFLNNIKNNNIKMKGYQSTTTKKNTALRFMGSNKDTALLLKLKAKKGTKAINLESVINEKGGIKESEILFDNNMKIKINKIYKDSKGYTIAEGEII